LVQVRELIERTQQLEKAGLAIAVPESEPPIFRQFKKLGGTMER